MLLKVMVPDADIPLVELSLQRGLEPAAHLAMGNALQPSGSEGVLFLGSGKTYHSVRGFFGGGTMDPKAEAFDAWLNSATNDGRTRNSALIDLDNAPQARDAQPYEDYLLPPMVATDAAPGEPGSL